jgi:hypothetical protein
MLTVPDCDGCAELNWLLYGVGRLGTNPHGAVPLATSVYQPPALLSKIATDDSVACMRYRQGGEANFIVYRTPEFMLSALQDYRPGRRAAQTHVFQLTMPGKTTIFFSCPETTGEGGGLRPDYWSGNATLPRVFGERNVAVLLFRHGETGWMSHCWFERDRFDEVCERDGWLFARKRDAYVGIWSEHGYEPGRTGQYAGRELICYADDNAWVVEAGRKADWNSFDAFVEAVSSATPGRRDERLVYASPSVGSIEMGWAGPILLNGAEADTTYPLIDGPYGHAEYDSGDITLRFGEDVARVGCGS